MVDVNEPEQLPVPPERVLRDLLDAFDPSGAADAGFAAHVLGHVREALALTERRRMPTLIWPRTAVDEVPDAPPVPPGAL